MTTYRMAQAEALAEIQKAREEGRSANLRYADLSYADLRSANLRSADLSYADLSSADLRSANGGILQIIGLHPYPATIAPTPDGWHLTIGCWDGTIDDLATLAASNKDWPEARGAEVEQRRPLLEAIVATARAHVVYRAGDLKAVQDQWNKSEGTQS